MNDIASIRCFREMSQLQLLLYQRTRPAATAQPVTASPLSTRQHEVLALLANGMSNRQVAGHLCVPIHTVRNHVQNICQALDVHSRGAAVATAQRNGWLGT